LVLLLTSCLDQVESGANVHTRNSAGRDALAEANRQSRATMRQRGKKSSDEQPQKYDPKIIELLEEESTKHKHRRKERAKKAGRIVMRNI